MTIGNTMILPEDIPPRESFVSVVIPTFCRTFYLDRCLATLEEFADMPYEVIVHDDASDTASRKKLFEMSDRISTIVFNNGANFGLSAAGNRCVKMARSKYILFLNDDCFFERPCLSDLCKTLGRPYVGTVAVAQDGNSIKTEEMSKYPPGIFSLSSSMGCGATIAFRKDVWKTVGGFDERSPMGQADNVFIHSIKKAGFWRAVLVGSPRAQIGNYEKGVEHITTQPITQGRESHLPKIFGLDGKVWSLFSAYKREACQWWVDGERTIPNREEVYEGISFDGTRYTDTRGNKKAGLNDIPYWGSYFEAIFGGSGVTDTRRIDWSVAARHGQALWRKEIEQDFGLT